jgi:nitrogen fixation NifU-like protein
MGLAMDELYRDYILEHYKEPHHFGELDAPDMQAHDVNPLCGDELGIQLKVDENGVITDVAFQGKGCAISQAAASIASDELVGMSIEEVKKLDADWMVDLLGIDVSATRRKCALLNLKVLRGAVIGDASWPDE